MEIPIRTNCRENDDMEYLSLGEIAQRLIPPADVLGFPVLRLSESESERVTHGGEITAEGPPLRPGQYVAALEPGGQLRAVLEVRPGRRLQPVRVLPLLAP